MLNPYPWDLPTPLTLLIGMHLGGPHKLHHIWTLCCSLIGENSSTYHGSVKFPNLYFSCPYLEIPLHLQSTQLSFYIKIAQLSVTNNITSYFAQELTMFKVLHMQRTWKLLVCICTQWAPGTALDMNSMWPIHKILISLLGFQSGCRSEHHILLFFACSAGC